MAISWGSDMATVKTNLDQPAASRVPFRPLANLPASDVQAAIAYLLTIAGSHQAQSDILDDIAGLTQAADKGIYFDSPTSAATFDLTTFARSILAAVDAAAARTLLELVIGTDVQAYSSVLDNTTASFTTTDETKLGHITVTQAVDLDALETDVAALSNAVVLKGTWDASSGSFPGAGSAKPGWSYIVSGSGTVDGVAFTANDRIVAIADNASTSTYAANWHKLDYTDQVLSVAGKTGAVTLAAADLTDASANGVSLITAADYAAMRSLLSLGSLATLSSINNGNWSGTDLAVANGGTGASDAATAFGNLKQAATSSATGVVEHAVDSEIRSAATGNLVVLASHIETASAGVALSDAATVAVNWDAGINFTLTVTANRTIGNPSNGQPGTWRTILVQGNNTTDRTISFGNQYLGEVPTITDCDSGRWYLLMIYCVSSSHFVVSAKKANGT